MRINASMSWLGPISSMSTSTAVRGLLGVTHTSLKIPRIVAERTNP